MLKDLVDTLSPDEMCKYCTLNDECEGHQVSPASNGQPVFAPCTDSDHYIKELFDVDSYIGENLDGLSLCKLCNKRPECEKKMSECKNIDKLELPCSGGKLDKERFEEGVFKALLYHMGGAEQSMSIEIGEVKKE